MSAPGSPAMGGPALRIVRRIEDDPYAWTASYAALAAHRHVGLTLRLQFRAGRGITGDDLARVQAETTEAMARYYRPRFVLKEAAGEQRPLHLSVEFVTSDPDLQVMVHPGSGRDNLQHWFMHSGVAARAHEIGHAFGFKDEYVDPLVANRATPGATGVYRDHSLMGDFHREGAEDAELKLRHVAGIADDLGARLGRELKADLAGRNACTIEMLRAAAQRFITGPAGGDRSPRLRR